MPINIDELTRFTQRLVQTRTLSGEEKPAIDMVAAEMTRLGFEEVAVDVYGNVTGVINGAASGPTLLMDAHVDTVTIAPGIDWRFEPFSATIAEGKLYGRGSADMKGPLAAMLHGAAAVDKSALAGRIVVSASVMEEVVEGWLLAPILDKYAPDFVVIGEPTDLNLSHGGRGRAELHLEAQGIPTHSSAPHLGKNPVLPMARAIDAISRLEMPTHPLLGTGVLALTDIISEPWPGNSMIPSRCRVTYDRRLLVDETEESILEMIRALPELDGIRVEIGAAAYTTYTSQTIRLPKWFPAWNLGPDHAYVQTAFAGLEAAGLTPNKRVYQFCTNAAYTAGVKGIPTVGFGPSPEGRAHIVDEYITLDDLHAAAQGYQGIAAAVLR